MAVAFPVPIIYLNANKMIDQTTSVLQFNGLRVRVINNEPWFVGKDVCTLLNHSNHNKALGQLDADEVTNDYPIKDRLGRNQKIKLINESGLYHLIFLSRREEAKTFRKWVTSEVLPSIRAKGSYALTQKLEQAQANYDRLHDSWREIYEEHTELREENRRLEYERNSAKDQQDTLRRAAVLKECHIRALTQEVETLKKELSKKISLELQGWQPRKENEHGSTAPVATESCRISKLARTLRSMGIDTGERRLLSWCRANGYLHTKGEERNRPTERALERGYFEVASSEVIVTPQGQNHILDRLLTSF